MKKSIQAHLDNQSFLQEFLDLKAEFEASIPQEDLVVETQKKPLFKLQPGVQRSSVAKQQKLTASNLKKLEGNAPGPADLNPRPTFCDKKVSIAPLPQYKPKIEQIQAEPMLLYPNYSLTRPNHSPAVVYRKQHKQSESKSERGSEASFASTAPTSTLSKSSVSIAPITSLKDKELEILLRKQFKSKPQHVASSSVISYKVVDPEPRAKVITDSRTVRKDKVEVEIMEYNKAAVGQYNMEVEKSTIGGKFPLARKTQEIEIDNKQPINPNFEAVRKTAPQVSILPEHYVTTSQVLKQIEEMKVGPASHDPKYTLVERRPDFGVQKIFKESYVKPDEGWREGTIIDLNPMKPQRNRLVFKYKVPVERKVEAKPDEGRWVYYDVDLNAVRAELAKDIFIAGRMEPEEFRERQEFKRLLEEHIQRTQNRRPEAGDYEQPGGPQDNIPGPDFDKMISRPFMTEINEDDDIEGDVLILDPDKLGKRLPDIKFDKMLGRSDLNPIQEEDQEELILEPLLDFVRKKQPFFADFSKQLGREEKKTLDDDEYYLPIDPNSDPYPNDPGKPREIVYSFGHGPERFQDDKLNNHQIDEPLILDVKYPGDRPVKTLVNMQSAEPRFVEKLPQDPFYYDQPLNEFTNDVLSAVAATKPEQRKFNFGKQAALEKNKDLKQVMSEQEAKTQKQQAAKQMNKQKYTVSNNFTPKQSQKPKLARNNNKKPVFKSAEDEVNQYMKDLGLL